MNTDKGCGGVAKGSGMLLLVVSAFCIFIKIGSLIFYPFYTTHSLQATRVNVDHRETGQGMMTDRFTV